MSFFQYLNTWPGFSYRTQARVYEVNITSVPERFVNMTMSDGSVLYGEPVAWARIRLFRPIGTLVYPWVPITQNLVHLIQPVIGTTSGGDELLDLEPGVVGTITRIDN